MWLSDCDHKDLSIGTEKQEDTVRRERLEGPIPLALKMEEGLAANKAGSFKGKETDSTLEPPPLIRAFNAFTLGQPDLQTTRE